MITHMVCAIDCLPGIKDDDDGSLAARAMILNKISKAEKASEIEVIETRTYIRQTYQMWGKYSSVSQEI